MLNILINGIGVIVAILLMVIIILVGIDIKNKLQNLFKRK